MFYPRYCIYINVTFSIRPSLFIPCSVHKPILYVCISISALQIGSSVPFFLEGTVISDFGVISDFENKDYWMAFNNVQNLINTTEFIME